MLTELDALLSDADTDQPLPEASPWVDDGTGALWLTHNGRRVGPYIAPEGAVSMLRWGGVAGGGRGRAELPRDRVQAMAQAMPLVRAWWAEFREQTDSALAEMGGDDNAT